MHEVSAFDWAGAARRTAMDVARQWFGPTRASTNSNSTVVLPLALVSTVVVACRGRLGTCDPRRRSGRRRVCGSGVNLPERPFPVIEQASSRKIIGFGGPCSLGRQLRDLAELDDGDRHLEVSPWPGSGDMQVFGAGGRHLWFALAIPAVCRGQHRHRRHGARTSSSARAEEGS